MDELENRQQRVSKQWELKLQRAKYEVDLAERRYEEVDPANRLVAATLEKRWNESLTALDVLQKQCNEQIAVNPLADLASRKDELLKLAQDFPRLWHATSTSHKDRKRMIRLLIKEIIVKVTDDRKQAILYIQWLGGASEEILVKLPPKTSEKWRCSPEIIERVRALALCMTDQEIVDKFNQEGLQTNKRNTYTLSSIKWIRFKYKISSYNLRKPGELSINEVSQKFNVSHHVVRYWIERKYIDVRKVNGHLWISLTSEKEKELFNKINCSTKIKKVRSIKSQNTTEGDAL